MLGKVLRIAAGYLGGPGKLEPLEFEDVPYPFPERFLNGKSLKLCSVSAGSGRGPLIVFLHPGSADLTTFSLQMAALSKQARVIAFDLPGHGKSGRTASPMTPEGMAEEIWAALDSIKERKLCLVGNSLGGGVALAMALSRPDRVGRLALIAPAGTRVAGPIERLLYSAIVLRASRSPSLGRLRLITEGLMFHRPCVASGALIEKMLRLKKGSGYDAWRRGQEGMLDIMLGWSIENRLSEIPCPTLLVWGKQDRMVPISEAYRFHEKMPDSQLRLIDKCGHAPQLEQPEKVTAALGSFLL